MWIELFLLAVTAFVFLYWNRKRHNDRLESHENPQISRKGKLQVIGAGLCRTGTMSTKAALEKLLDNQECHHYKTLIDKPEDGKDFWDRVIGSPDEVTVEEWKAFFESRHYASCIDTPCSPHFEKLMKAFPDAKVLLTVREPRAWYKSAFIFLEVLRLKDRLPLSILKYIMPSSKRSPSLQRMEKMNYLPYEGTGGESIAGVLAKGPEASDNFFNAWAEYVKRTVPREKLLVFQVKEGWGPLCTFLDKPVPNEPFPWLNDGESVRSFITSLTTFAWCIVILGPLCCLGLLLYLYLTLLAN